MKVGVIGGGSIGLLFSYYLAEHHDVTLYTRTKNQAEELNRKGISLVFHQTVKVRSLSVTPLSGYLQDHDVLFLTVKQYDLPGVLKTIKNLENIPTIVFLQNGMGHLRYFEQLVNEDVVVGVVEHGAQRIDHTTVQLNGRGVTKISAVRGSEGSLMRLWEEIDRELFPLIIERNWYPMLAEKLIINASINPLTSLYNIENGELLYNRFFNYTMRKLFDEVVLVLQISNQENMWEKVNDICLKTSNNRSSMLRDIDHARKTEVDAILGYILELAEEKNVELKLINFLYMSLKGIEKRGGS